jgi:hypothetical protein
METGNYKSDVIDIPPDKAREFSKNPSYIFMQMILPVIFFLALVTSSAWGLETRFRYVDIDSGSILTDFAIADSIPSHIVEFISKGVPVAFEYRLDLRKIRHGWFDGHMASRELTYRVRYDTWEKKYTVIEIRSGPIIEHILFDSREVFDLVTKTSRVSIPLNDTSGTFYLVGKLYIKTMTLSNFKEVESWLKGEIIGVKKPDMKSASDDFGEFLFNTALKITGLRNISDEIRTGNFRIGDLPLRIDKQTEQ